MKKIEYPQWASRPYGDYTYSDYLSWGQEVRVELVDGMVYLMAGAGTGHQRLAGDVYVQLRDFLKDKNCEAFIAPLDVRLQPKENLSDKTVVQPDILVVCDKAKINEHSVNGAPDFIVEIMSLHSRAHDILTKKELYEAAKVREYWVVDKVKDYVLYKWVLQGGFFTEEKIPLACKTEIPVGIFEGCVISL
ncbi:MAG: Uma2 family endonuclease [Spirochaetes bacterium]|nr:Uma2 family endonuclease [Spirochaetota bacterium]